MASCLSPDEVGGEASDPIDEDDALGNHLSISVVEAEKRANGALNLKEYFTAYLIETKTTNPKWVIQLAKISAVWRRYTEFEQLKAYFELIYPYIVLPPLPEKKVTFSWQKTSTDTFDPDFVDRRRAGLENFLLRLAGHPVLSRDAQLVEFLQQEEGWRQSDATKSASGSYLQLAESKLKALSVAVRLRKTNPDLENCKSYSSDLQKYLGKFLANRCRIVQHEYDMYRLHAHYGRVFSEWSAVEREMGDSLQKTGHYLDSLAHSIDGALEDEELFADQLKEYLFYAGSLKAVCRHHEALQLQLEACEDTLIARTEEKNKVQSGKATLISRFFGTVDSDVVKGLKINLLDLKIEDDETALKRSKDELEDFTLKAQTDIKRFEKQKNADLKETLTNYSALQLKLAKKGLQTWINIRDCLQSMS